MIIIYDPELRRPGCVLLQAALRGTVPQRLFHELFPAENWLTYPTPGMKRLETDEATLRRVAALAPRDEPTAPGKEER